MILSTDPRTIPVSYRTKCPKACPSVHNITSTIVSDNQLASPHSFVHELYAGGGNAGIVSSRALAIVSFAEIDLYEGGRLAISGLPAFRLGCARLGCGGLGGGGLGGVRLDCIELWLPAFAFRACRRDISYIHVVSFFSKDRAGAHSYLYLLEPFCVNCLSCRQQY